MSTIWAIARHMISEGLRMKIALVFVVLMALIGLGLPFSIRGDGSVTGAVQSFLSYSLQATGILLGMLTIFMSRSLSDELVDHQLFLVMSKPVPRWQYVVGKWFGITLLNAVFLGFAGAMTCGMVYYIKWSRPPLDERFDKAQLENEILVARHARPVKVPIEDFKRDAEFEFNQNLEQGFYENMPDFDPKKELKRLTGKKEARWRVVSPLGVRIFEFDQVLCNRSPKHYVQLRYKTNVSRVPPDEIYRAWWSFGDATKNTATYDRRTRHVVDRYHTIRVPADAVAADNTLRVAFYNQNPFKGEELFRTVIEFRQGDGPELFFVVGSFVGNVFRLLVLIMCKLMFLAAVAILMTTFLSFPVACMCSFTVYILAGARSFIADGLDFASTPDAGIFDSFYDFFLWSFTHVFSVLQWIVPDFSYYDAVESLANGHNVGLVWVLQAIGELALLKTGIILGVAVLLFQRREVAEVSL